MKEQARVHVYLNFSLCPQNVDKWSFDVFALNEASGDHALKFIFYELLTRYDLISRFKVSHKDATWPRCVFCQSDAERLKIFWIDPNNLPQSPFKHGWFDGRVRMLTVCHLSLRLWCCISTLNIIRGGGAGRATSSRNRSSFSAAEDTWSDSKWHGQ